MWRFDQWTLEKADPSTPQVRGGKLHGRADTARSLASAPTFGLFALPALRGVASAAWDRPHNKGIGEKGESRVSVKISPF